MSVTRLDTASADAIRMSASMFRADGPIARMLELQGQLRSDSGETMFFLRELEQILKEQFDTKYAVLKGKQFVPIRNDIDPGAESVTYTAFDYSGVAQRVRGSADDFPEGTAAGVQITNPLMSYGSSFSYTIDELRAANKAGRSLDRIRALTARKMIDQKVDAILANGDASVDFGPQTGFSPMNGLINLPNTQTQTAQSQNASTLWIGNKTADQIISDVSTAISTVPSTTKDVEHVRRCILPVAQYQYISQTPRSTISDTTILEFLKGNNDGVEFTSWERLGGAGSAGTNDPTFGTPNRAIFYDPDPMQLFCPMAVEFEQFAPQLVGLRYRVQCRTKLGGVVAPFPKSVLFLDGI